jgi:mannitol-1-phosphate 5-dehydrogenase
MKRTVVQFGAGNIGRGFLAQLFHESGLEVAFVDVDPRVVCALNERGAYAIHIVGAGAREVAVSNVRAIHGAEREEVAEAVAGCEIACTAVGAGALKHIAGGLAEGLSLRAARGGGPLNILICENLHDASDMLRGLVAERLPADEREAILARTGFVQAVVSRMVPLQSAGPGGDSLGIRVEAYQRLPVDARAVVGEMPSIAGVEPVTNFEAHVERKLYTHNCLHATLGYLGWRAGIRYAYEALADPEIAGVFDRVAAETGEALVRRHGFDPEEHAAHVADLRERFLNRDLGDTCYRLARDPIRKLAPDDRLTGAARLCEAEGVEPRALPTVIAAALRFSAPEDPSATELRTSITQVGVGETVRKYCVIDPMEPLGVRVRDEYERLAGR